MNERPSRRSNLKLRWRIPTTKGLPPTRELPWISLLLAFCVTPAWAVPDLSKVHVLDKSRDGAACADVADLDGDGDLDILLVSAKDDVVSWHEQGADGSFTKTVLSEDLDAPNAITSRDLDGDGDVDFVVAARNSGQVVWFENLGNGKFSEPQEVVSGVDDPTSAIVGDLDGDGDQDVAWTQHGDNVIAWSANDGSGSFGDPISIDQDANGAWKLHAADVDGDGDLDLFAALYAGDRIVWYENQPDGSFANGVVLVDDFDGASSVRTGDFDGDGDLDLVASAYRDDLVIWLENQGSGAFSAGRMISDSADGPTEVNTSDVDLDGDHDVIVSIAGSDEVVWYENSEHGFSDAIVVNDRVDGARWVIAADVDSDGDPDLVWTAWNGDNAGWNENVQEAPPPPPPPPSSGEPIDLTESRILDEDRDAAACVDVTDLDGDGDMDILLVSAKDDIISWHEVADGGFTRHVVSSRIDAPNSVQAGDLDGDGDMDFVVAARLGDEVVWFENLGGGEFSDEREVASNINDAAFAVAADFDGDGDLDVAWALRSGDEIAWAENSGDGSFGASIVIDGNADGAWKLHAADLDGDRDLDLMAALFEGDQILWYENESSGAFSEAKVLIDDFDGASSVRTGDFDGDGDLDILASSYRDDLVVWLENLGSGSFSGKRIISNESDGPTEVNAEDLDRDGDYDVFAALAASNQIVWYENVEDGFEDPVIVNSEVDGARWVMAADVDGDADYDLVWAAWRGDQAGWNENAAGKDPPPPPPPVVSERPPTAEVEVTQVAGGAASLHVAWRPLLPEEHGDAAVTSYEVKARPSLGGPELGCTATALETSCTVAGAIPQIAQDVYLVTVVAQNRFGDGPAGPYQYGVPFGAKNQAAQFGTEHWDIINEFNGASSSIAVDLDGDGDLDVASVAYVDDLVVWAERLEADFGEVRTIGSGDSDAAVDAFGPLRIRAGDLDLDGDQDLVVAARHDDEVVWYENLGDKEFSAARVLVANAEEPTWIEVVDLNGDLRPDVLYAAHADDEIAWIQNLGLNSTGDPIYSNSKSISRSAQGVWTVHAQDLDGDGDADVLSASIDDDTVGWFEQLEDGSFSARKILSDSVDGASSVYAGDIDGDGDVDVAAASYRQDSVLWFEQASPGVFEPKRSVGSINGPAQVVLVDLDIDGDLDVLAAAIHSKGAFWFENLGATFAEAKLVTGVDGARSVESSDMDGDGDWDVLVSGYYSDTVVWAENKGEGAKPTEPLSAVADLQVAGLPGAIHVSWTPLASDQTGGTRILHYRVSATNSRTGFAVECIATWLEHECVFENLDEDAEYLVTVVAVNALGSSPEARAVAATTTYKNRSISGTVFVPEYYRVDSDSEDPNNETVPNDDQASAQAMPLKVMVGGHVDSELDKDDWYRIDLQGEEMSIVLLIAERRGAPHRAWIDLDLYLYDADGTVVDVSLNVNTPHERIEVGPNLAGTHYVRVQAPEEGGLYLLSLGYVSPNTVDQLGIASHRTLSGQFVPDEMIVRLNDSASGADLALQADALTGSHRLTVESGAPHRAMRMRSLYSEQSAALLPTEVRTGNEVLRFSSARQAAVARTLLAAKEVARAPGVQYAEPNYLYQPLAEPDDESFPLQWHLESINVPDAWDIEKGDGDIVIAILDSGYLDHPDLIGRLAMRDDGTVAGYDFISRQNNGEWVGGDGDGIDDDPFDIAYNSHGTHVAGTAGAETDNGQGIAGVTWNASILPIRVLPGSPHGASVYDVGQGLLYAAGLENDSGTLPDNPADVINVSLGGSFDRCLPYYNRSEFFSSLLTDVIKNAGVAVVKAAGNSACRYVDEMSQYPDVIVVAATDYSKKRARYSNYGEWIDVAAPGGDTSKDLNDDGNPDGILSTVGYENGNWDYEWWAGTSMAAPHVAGVIALMRSANPDLTVHDVLRLIRGDHPDANAGPITQDLGDPGFDLDYGHGLIDAHMAVSISRQIDGGTGKIVEPELYLPRLVMYFWPSWDLGSIPYENRGLGGELEISGIEIVQGDWLSVADDPDAGRLVGTVDRTKLSDGENLAEFIVKSNGGNQRLMALALVAEAGASPDIGTLHVIADAFDASGQLMGRYSAETDKPNAYAYTLKNVVPAEYYLYGGTDLDGDGVLCEDGELCGAFATLPLRIETGFGETDFEGADFLLEARINGYEPWPDIPGARVEDEPPEED